MTWKGLPWLCLDTETTGTDTATDRIVQLGAVWMQHGELMRDERGKPRRHLVHVNPGMPIPAESTAVHGVTDERVADAPPFPQVFSAFLHHLESAAVIVGHNLKRFDWPLLQAEAERYGRSEDLMRAVDQSLFVDTLVHVRRDEIGRWWSGPGRHRLTTVIERWGIGLPGDAHRADYDAHMSGRILWHTLCELPDDRHECHRLMVDCAAAQEADYQQWRARKDAEEAANDDRKAGVA